jgi:hypothetical protein
MAVVMSPHRRNIMKWLHSLRFKSALLIGLTSIGMHSSFAQPAPKLVFASSHPVVKAS